MSLSVTHILGKSCAAVQAQLQNLSSIPGCDLQVSFVKEAIMKVLNLALMFADGWQAGLGAWQ